LLESPEVAAIVAAICQSTGVSADAVSVVFSHTHAAGLMSRDRADLPGGDLIAPYLESLNRTLGNLARQALDALSEAAITYGMGVCRLAVHRDQWDAQAGQWVCGFNPDGDADDTLLVARITAATDGRPLATIVNYACHPTTLAWDNTLISPDFPGAMRDVVEQATGGPCVFLQGASGDLGPREGFVGDVAIADRNGRQLGYATLAVVESLPPPCREFAYQGPVVSGATIGVWSHVPLDPSGAAAAAQWHTDRRPLPLAYRRDLPRADQVAVDRDALFEQERAARQRHDAATAADLRALAERKTRLLARLNALPGGETYPYEISLWRMGDAVWLAVQGEPYQQLQRDLRRRFPGVALVIATIAGGWGPSYLPPAAIYDQSIYQAQVAVLAAGSLEQLTDALADRIGSLLSAD